MDRELGGLRLPEDHRPGFPEGLDDGGVVVRHEARVEGAAHGRPHALGVVDVLDSEGDAVEGAPDPALLGLPGGGLRGLHGGLWVHGDPSLDDGLQRVYPVQEGLGEPRGREASIPYHAGRLGQTQSVRLHHLPPGLILVTGSMSGSRG